MKIACLALAATFLAIPGVTQSSTVRIAHPTAATIAFTTNMKALPKCIYCYRGDPFDPCPTIPINPPCTN